MPVVLTDAYRNKTFILPFSPDKSECAFIKPLTDTEIDKIRRKSAKEGGADDALVQKFFIKNYLMETVTDWKGFYDVAGNVIPFSVEMIKELYECDPEFILRMYMRVRNVAREGELEERKN